MSDKTPEQIIALAIQSGADVIPNERGNDSRFKYDLYTFTISELQAFAALTAAQPAALPVQKVTDAEVRAGLNTLHNAYTHTPLSDWGPETQNFMRYTLEEFAESRAVTAALPVPAHDVEAAIERIARMNSTKFQDLLNALRVELLAAAGSKT